MRKFWTYREIEILKDEYPFMPTKLIAEQLNKSISQVYNKVFHLKLKKDDDYLNSEYSGRLTGKDTRGLKTRFKKGHKSWNKGMKGLKIGGEETQFKIGHIPHNHRHIGSIRKNTNSYLYIKIDEPKEWMALHQYNWIQANGEIPEGMFLKFCDGNPLNCDVNNLYLSDRISNMKENTIHRYPTELKSTIRALGKLKRKINGTE